MTPEIHGILSVSLWALLCLVFGFLGAKQAYDIDKITRRVNLRKQNDSATSAARSSGPKEKTTAAEDSYSTVHSANVTATDEVKDKEHR